MTWSGLITSAAEKGFDLGWIKELLTALEWILWVALILVGACGAVYAIYVGVKMARADSSEQREEAKKRLINIIVAIVVTIALILFFNLLLPVILNAFNVFDELANMEQTSITNIAQTARLIIG